MFQGMTQGFYDDMLQQLNEMKDSNIDLQLLLTLFSFECANNENCYNIMTDTQAQ